MIPELIGAYALQVYMPLSDLSREWRRFSRKIRGNEAQALQQVRRPTVSWRELSSAGRTATSLTTRA